MLVQIGVITINSTRGTETGRTGGAYLKDQRLICGSWCIQAFRAVEGALVFKHSPREGELSRPVNAPASGQVILLMEASDCEVTGGYLQFLDFNASGPRGNDDYWIIF